MVLSRVGGSWWEWCFPGGSGAFQGVFSGGGAVQEEG